MSAPATTDSLVEPVNGDFNLTGNYHYELGFLLDIFCYFFPPYK